MIDIHIFSIISWRGKRVLRPTKKGCSRGKIISPSIFESMRAVLKQTVAAIESYYYIQYCCVDFLYSRQSIIATQTECWIWLTFPNKRQDLWAIFCTGKKANNRWFWSGSLCKREWKSCAFPLYQQQYKSLQNMVILWQTCRPCLYKIGQKKIVS